MDPMNYMTWNTEDFSGGMTDVVAGGRKNQGEIVANFRITSNQKLLLRPGSESLDSNHVSTVKPEGRTGNLINYQTDTALLIRAKQKLFYKNGSNVWTNLTGPGSKNMLPDGTSAFVEWSGTTNTTTSAFTTGSIVSSTESSGHLYAVGHDPSLSQTEFAAPVKVYQKVDGTFQLKNMSMPKFPGITTAADRYAILLQAITLAHDLRDKMTAHFARTAVAFTVNTSTETATTAAAHGMHPGQRFQFATTGSVGGLSNGGNYFMVGNADGSSNFQFATTLKNAIASTAINLTSTSGTHSFKYHKAAQDSSAFSALVASTEDTLSALTQALLIAYTAHIDDARLLASVYHMWGITDSSGDNSFGHFYVNDTAPPTSLETSIPILNRLRTAFNTHLYSYVSGPSHNNGSDSSTSVTRTASLVHAGGDITGVVTSPKVRFSSTLTFGDAIGFLAFDWFSSIKSSFRDHVVKTSGQVHHASADFGYQFPPGDVKSGNYNPGYGAFEECLIQTYWIAHSYELHRVGRDSVQPSAVVSENGNDTYGGAHYTGTTEAATGLTVVASYVQGTHSGLSYLYDEETASGVQSWYAAAREIMAQYDAHYTQWDAATGRHQGAIVFPTPNPYTDSLPHPSFNLITRNLVFTTYTYDFVYQHKYLAKNSITFETRGTPLALTTRPVIVSGEYATVNGSATAIVLADKNIKYQTALPTMLITNIPAQAAGEHYPTSEMYIEIYRSAVGGSLTYLVSKITNGTTSFLDTTFRSTQALTDSYIQSQSPLYTQGGVLPNDPAPKAQAIVTAGAFTYYGGIVEKNYSGATFLPYRIRQSHDHAPDSCPESFYVDLPTELRTLGVARGLPIAVSQKGVYRIDGFFSELGQGGMTAVAISDTIGGVSIQGGATLHDIFYFAGTDGFYMTDGYQVTKISQHLDDTYAALVTTAAKRRTIQCQIDRTRQLVYWTIPRGGSEASALFVLDTKQPIVEGEASFTIDANSTHYNPTAVVVYLGDLYRGDKDGLVFRHDDTLTTDPKLTGGALSGDLVSIPWQWRSVADPLGDPSGRKWVPRCSFRFANHGNLSVLPRSINDLNTANIRSLNSIRFRGEYAGVITEKRTFPAATSSGTNGGLRCTYKQIDLIPGTPIIASSDNVTPSTLASVSGSSVTLDSSIYDWPADCEDWSISFETDNYVTQYLITNRVSGDTLTVSGTPVFSGSKKWQLRGTPKDEKIEILGISVYFMGMSLSQHASTGVSGGNA